MNTCGRCGQEANKLIDTIAGQRCRRCFNEVRNGLVLGWDVPKRGPMQALYQEQDRIRTKVLLQENALKGVTDPIGAITSKPVKEPLYDAFKETGRTPSRWHAKRNQNANALNNIGVGELSLVDGAGQVFKSARSPCVIPKPGRAPVVPMPNVPDAPKSPLDYWKSIEDGTRTNRYESVYTTLPFKLDDEVIILPPGAGRFADPTSWYAQHAKTQAHERYLIAAVRAPFYDLKIRAAQTVYTTVREEWIALAPPIFEKGTTVQVKRCCPEHVVFGLEGRVGDVEIGDSRRPDGTPHDPPQSMVRLFGNEVAFNICTCCLVPTGGTAPTSDPPKPVLLNLKCEDCGCIFHRENAKDLLGWTVCLPCCGKRLLMKGQA